MKKLNIIYSLIVVIISFTGCAKDGETGPQGQQGPQGETGQNGINGNANVTSFSYTVSLSGGQWINLNNGVYHRGNINIPNPNKDLVQAYVQYPFNGNEWFGLAASNIAYIGDIVDFSYNSTQVNFYYIFNNHTKPPHTMVFKVVVIPASARIANPNLDLNDYEAVKAAYNLKD